MAETFYKTLHSKYFPLQESTHSFLRSDRFRKCLSFLVNAQPRDLLEIGFEDPFLSKTIVQHLGSNYFGIDISEASVNQARSMGLNALKVDVSSEVLPFADSSFDLVYASEVIEHLYDPDFAIDEFTRVLKPRGRMLLSTPNMGSWYNRLLLLGGIQPVSTEVSTVRILGRRAKSLGQGNRPVGHIRVFTLRAFLDFLELHNLRPVQMMGYGLEKLGRLSLVDRAVARFPELASGFIALIEKSGKHDAF